MLGAFLRQDGASNDSRCGSWTNLRNIAGRVGFRLDPKYRWLWDYQDGVICGNPSRTVRLDTVIEIVELTKVPEGDLKVEAQLIDLEYVESRQAIIRKDEVPTVESVASTKVAFSGADLLFSKLEPYLGKVILGPPAGAIGSMEWIGLKVKDSLPVCVAAYLLMLPETCEALRRLQSGKRHARLQPTEMLEMKIELPPRDEWSEIDRRVRLLRYGLLKARAKVARVRVEIDLIFEGVRVPYVRRGIAGQAIGAEAATSPIPAAKMKTKN